jgi:peptidyl-prolyl cis-trans isomerase SurA
MRAWIIACATLVASGAGLQAELIDRVLAVVNGEVVTLSDMRGVLRLRLVRVEAGAGQIESALAREIDRMLMLEDVDRFAAPEPAPDALASRLDRVRAEFAEPGAFARALAAAGYDEEMLRGRVRDDLRIERYVEQRFSGVIPPSDEEIRGYAAQHRAELSGDQQLSEQELLRRAQQRLIDERRRALVADWLSGLHRRAEIRRPSAPGEPAR